MAEDRTARDATEGESREGAAVELSLRLRTGSSAGAAAAQADATAARRSMTIFYNGRVCAVDVTEFQARAIITMANQHILMEQRCRDRDRHQDDSGSSSTGAARPKPPAMHRDAALPPSLRQQGLEAPPMINHAATAGLTMKRSLQRFLQKRKTRAVTTPYAGGRPTRHPYP